MGIPLEVVISGGGIGGLALAQGLRRRGHRVRVLERRLGPRTGFRLHMNADGGNALEALLPPELYALYQQTSRTDPRKEQLHILDPRLKTIAARPHIGPPNDREPRHTAVHRGTFREILSAGLEDVMEEAEVVGSDVRGDRAVAILADGREVEGDILVAFDGLNSPIREQLLPDVQVVDTGIQSIFARTPLTPEIAAGLSPQLFDGFVIVFGPQLFENGVLAVGAYEPRQEVASAARRLGAGPELTPVEPYIMLGGSVPRSLLDELGIDAETAGPDELHRALRALVRGWSPEIVGLVDRAEPETAFWTPMRRLTISEPWAPSRVTFGGDAIHAMPPSLGAGANLALRDARLIMEALDRVEASGDVVPAIAHYETQMREYDFPILERASTQQGAASGFTPLGLVRLIRMVGIRRIIEASRRRDASLSTKGTLS